MTPRSPPNSPLRDQSWTKYFQEVAGVFVDKTLEQGAATTMVVAVGPEFANTGGHCLTDHNEAPTLPNDADLFKNGNGDEEWVIDPVAAKMWTLSLDLHDQPHS